MKLGDLIVSIFQMDEDAWARHANPWSVWSRTTVLPGLILAACSRVWIGWSALVPGVIALLWTWLNPRLFGTPDSLDNWARSVCSENASGSTATRSRCPSTIVSPRTY